MYLMPGSAILPYKGKFPVLEKGVFVASGSQIIGDTEIGQDSSVWFNVVLRGDCNFIRVGQRTNIQDGTVIHVTNGLHPSFIGDDVTIGHGVILHGCRIGNLCLIGMGAIVMDDVTIPERCLVAAGSLVPPGKKFNPGTLIKGNPAREARALNDKELAELERSVQYYLEYKQGYMPH
ncbi:MAG: gamma carbonic anhydrase family protein [Proteobacteria bacterium]|nr:gamma carbonic anhydrase family protein [Pseudomonadota bacterium]